MRFLIINMYKKQSIFNNRKIGEMFIDGLRGNKVFFKKWDDVKGIRDALKGKRIDGKRIDGKRIDGKRIDGKRIDGKRIDGIIISGSDYFVDGKEHSIIDESILNSNLPILGVCYGFQSLIHTLGKPSYIKRNKRGYMGYTRSFSITKPFPVQKRKFLFHHRNYVVKVPKGFKIYKKIGNKIIIAYNSKKNILGVQFYLYKYKKTVRLFLDAWISNCVAPKVAKP
jgi:GMP synthase-like glutamine amidotransferase